MCAAVDAVNDQVMAVGDLIGEPAHDNPADDGSGLLIRWIMNDIIGGRAGQTLFRHLAVHGLDDVAALAHPAQRVLDIIGEAPLAGTNFLGQTEPPQFLQATGAQRLLEGVAVGGPDNAIFAHVPEQLTIETGQALLFDFAAQPVLDLEIRTRPEIQADDLGGPLAHAGGDIVPGDDQVLTPIIPATDDDVAVRMAGVVMIDGYPIELGTQIFFHLRHEAADKGLQVFVLRAILGGDDETELVAVAIGAVKEVLAIHPILLGA